MPYRYETHLHTCEGSACGRSSGREHARFYKERGYQGIFVTDHFFGGNTAVPADLPWKERVEQFCSGYEEALAEGQKIGLDVFFGWEQRFDQFDEYLVYGLDKQWLLNHPEMEHWTRREQFEGVHAAGGCIIQAHPFRDREYITRIILGKEWTDGIELVNDGNYPYNDVYALHYARKYNLVTTAGSDNHRSYATRWEEHPLLGVELDERLTSAQHFAKLVRSHGVIRPIIPEGRFDVPDGELPKLENFWLDEKDTPVPTGIDWLRM